jgi:malonyl-CoA/methylmalonyl-CoA synthetase
VSLVDLFDPSLRGRADQPALDFEDAAGIASSWTFGEIDARSDRMAQALRARGVAAGDRLAFCLPNRVAIIDLWLACAKLGVIAVPINVLYRARELAHLVRDATPRAVVTSRDLAGGFAAGTTTWDVDALEAEAASARAERPAVPCAADTPMALVYTSGTTGASKGAILTHGNFAANAVVLTAAWAITDADRFLCALPLFHVHGLGNGLHTWLVSGCRMRLVERFEHAKAPAWFTDWQPTLFFGVPTMYVRLLDVPEDTARAIGARMRLFVSGSAPLPAHVLEAFHARYGHVILERYGMTETLMNTSNPYAGERRAGTVGRALPMTSVRIRDEAGHDVPDGTEGELWVRGPNVCLGYWNRPDATAASFVDGWFRTGDVGVRAPDGYITLRGRRSDLIISGGFNIYPRELEELLLELPGIREAAVVGVADPVRGEVPVAYVVSDAEPDAAALDAMFRARVASFKVPRGYVRVDALPRTALGKVQKHRLPPWKGA